MVILLTKMCRFIVETSKSETVGTTQVAIRVNRMRLGAASLRERLEELAEKFCRVPQRFPPAEMVENICFVCVF